MTTDYIKITFDTYERSFLEALKTTDVREVTAIFYKKTGNGIEVFFSWNMFKIKFSISMEEMKAIYEGKISQKQKQDFLDAKTRTQ